ncbi:related to large nucleolar U3 ribonucleoprotein [Rhynchosporium agropyri]|uniref:Related to large nucleolar U3 ribonucleoprotein n=1 Tax=Rhynchosporium agropyri TaxID=914238 RepID=A0A1E1KCD0_9HELO|nr:related to large nucleolar U3 ribonucleoprotein [Rhynchosporium agropyri]
MPGRQSHGRAPEKKPAGKSAKKSNKRSLDAFAIASHENPDRVKVRQSRLGAQEGGSSRTNKNKRRRDEDDDEDEEDEEEEASAKKQKVKKGRFDELDVDEGSDSEGNEWKLGQVDSEDDSDLDSDEAFGESDEERFEGFAFGGGSDKKKQKSRKDRDVNLDEEDQEDSDSELDEGDMGDDAVDMATYLDMVDAEDAEEKASKGKGQERKKDDDEDMFSSEPDDDDSSDESEDSSSESSSDEDDDAFNPEKIAALDQMIESIPQDGDYREAAAKRRNDYNINTNEISMSGLPSSKKRKSQDEDVAGADPTLKESKSSKKKLAPSKVPLERRQQDRLDRSAAYDKSKETLDRWTDTVKHNRRADHLMFPLHDNEAASAHANKSLMPANLSKPFNELEATIQSILEESGLATADGKGDEDKIREFEELETKKMSIEEVRERRDQLRMARELMFREEAKSKRIKKIKSKSYRKVHRKQREKQERLEKEALLEGGFEPSEDEMEKQDRRRAEERMGAKHRESKWAKAMKGTGRAAWDEDARSGITEMARREEELRKRVEGRAVRKEFENDSDESLSDSDDDSNEEDDSGTRNRLLQNLKGLNDSDMMDESLPGAKLANMDFMRKADASRRKQNDVAAEELRRKLAGEETPSEEEDGDIGRRIFGPGSHSASQKKASKLAEFEERLGSDDEEGPELTVRGTDNGPKKATSSAIKPSKSPLIQPQPMSKPERHTEGGAWSKVTSKSAVVSEAEAKRRRHKKNDAIDVEELDLSKAAVIANKPKAKSTKKKGGNKSGILNDAISGSESDSENEDDSGPYLPFALRDQDLIKRAFAGADVVGEFEAEKNQIIEDEDEKVVDNTLPGWGSWVGDGVSKKENKKNSGRFLTKVDGIKADKRKDAKLEKVIINEKRNKKNSKYLATTLPHTFETQKQYERALRLPIGPQWSTKETFQDATKPRVLVKQGIIAPMAKPLF